MPALLTTGLLNPSLARSKSIPLAVNFQSLSAWLADPTPLRLRVEVRRPPGSPLPFPATWADLGKVFVASGLQIGAVERTDPAESKPMSIVFTSASKELLTSYEKAEDRVVAYFKVNPLRYYKTGKQAEAKMVPASLTQALAWIAEGRMAPGSNTGQWQAHPGARMPSAYYVSEMSLEEEPK